jgi:hypothetical protein
VFTSFMTMGSTNAAAFPGEIRSPNGKTLIMVNSTRARYIG